MLTPHSVHDVFPAAPWCCPAAQAVQICAPGLALALPGAQSSHEVCAMRRADVPAGQGEQIACPTIAANLPSSHDVQYCAPGADA